MNLKDAFLSLDNCFLQSYIGEVNNNILKL